MRRSIYDQALGHSYRIHSREVEVEQGAHTAWIITHTDHVTGDEVDFPRDFDTRADAEAALRDWLGE